MGWREGGEGMVSKTTRLIGCSLFSNQRRLNYMLSGQEFFILDFFLSCMVPVVGVKVLNVVACCYVSCPPLHAMCIDSLC